jgi:uncharacterized membrane protein YfhO
MQTFVSSKVLKVSMATTCFVQYGHHQVLKYVGETAAILLVLLLHIWSLRCARFRNMEISISFFVCRVVYIMW